MGGLLFRVRQLFQGSMHLRALMNGLDAAGKTSILYRLKLGEVVTTIPTIGFNVETVQHRNAAFTVWDVGGRDKIRPLWRHYYQNTTALIFVVDSNDSERLDGRPSNHVGSSPYSHFDDSGSARAELHRLLCEDELASIPLLVFANKQDLPRALPPEEVAERLGLHQLRRRPWLIQGCSAITGDGLLEGLEWLYEATKRDAALAAKAVPIQPASTTSSSSSSRIAATPAGSGVAVATKSPAPAPAPVSAPAPVATESVAGARSASASVQAPSSFAARRSGGGVIGSSSRRVVMDAISSDNPYVLAVRGTSSAAEEIRLPISRKDEQQKEPGATPSHTIPLAPPLGPVQHQRELSSAAVVPASAPAFDLRHSPLVSLQLRPSPAAATIDLPVVHESASARIIQQRSASAALAAAVGATASAGAMCSEDGEPDFVLIERVDPTDEPGAALDGDGELIWLDKHGVEVAPAQRPVALNVVG